MSSSNRARRMMAHHLRNKAQSELNLIPMIDILSVLVSFLLVNGIAPLFNDFGVDPPLVTRFVLGASQLVGGEWWSPLGILGVLVAAWVVLFVTLPTSRRRSLAGRIPVLGKVWRWTSLSEFCHLLGLLLESDIPLGSPSTTRRTLSFTFMPL